MADVELVIKISKDTVDAIKDNAMFADSISSDIRWDVTSAIVNGIPLPKGHGRLKDADEIANMVSVLKNNWDRNGNEYESGRYESYDYAVGTINDAPTIIEADTESEDNA